MKIDTSTKTLTSSSATGTKEAAPRAGKANVSASPKNSASAQDSVRITSLSSQLHALESGMESVPVVDAARVEAIKQAISEGRFKINPEVIADKLLASVKDLVQTP